MTKDRPAGGGMNLGAALDLSCLNQMPTQLVGFANGTIASDEEGAKPFDCIDRALNTFATLTRGESLETYRSEELRGFLNRYFMRDRQVSVELMSSLMQAKAAALGGTADQITRQDLAHVREFIAVLKTEVLRIRTIIPLFMGGRNLNPDQVSQATPLLLQAAENLGRTLEIATGDYRFDQLERLLHHLNAFIHGGSVEESDNSALSVASRFVPLMRGTKALIFGNDGEGIGAREWKTLLRVGAHLATGYMTFANRAEGMLWPSEPGVRVVAGIARAFAGAIREIPTSSGLLTVADQGRFRDSVSTSIRGMEGLEQFAQFVGLGLLGARTVFGDAEGNILVSRIEALPVVLNSMAPDVAPIATWIESSMQTEVPFEAFTRAGRWLADYMAQRAPLDQHHVEDSIRFVADLVSDSEKFLGYVPLAYALKALLAGHAPTRVSGRSWHSLIESAADLSASLWLFRSQVGSNPGSWQSDSFQTALRAAVSATLDSIVRIARRHPNEVISFERLDEALFAFGHVAAQNEISLPVSIPTLSRTLRPIFQRMFAGRDPNIRRAPGITIPAIRLAKREFLRWSVTQGVIERAFLRRVEATHLSTAVVSINQLRETAHFFQSSGATREMGSELLDLLDRYPRLMKPGEVKLLFPEAQADLNLRNYDELTWLNAVRSATKLIGEGYTSQAPRAGALSITAQEMQQAFLDVFGILQEMHQVDADDEPAKLATDLAKYGNLFASSGNGNDTIEEGEAAEMLLHVLSGRTLREELVDALLAAGCRATAGTAERPDGFDMRCVRRKLFQETALFNRFFAPIMPRMVAEVAEYDQTERNRFFTALEKGSREGDTSDAPFSRSALKRFIHLLQFGESMVQRLDEDWSNALEHCNETYEAFEVFRNELETAANMSGFIIEAVFGHILRYGIPPRTPDNCGNWLRCLSRAIGLPAWLLNYRIRRGCGNVTMSLNRLKLMTLFSSLATD